MSKLFQHNSYSTLYGGVYEGSITLAQMLEHAPNGIGTLDGAHGEVIVIDGEAYMGDENGEVRPIELDETMPYVAAVEHSSDINFKIEDLTQQSDVFEQIIAKFPTQNTAYSVVIKGKFDKIQVSSKPPKNTGPYLEVLANQPHFKAENISGTLIGIWPPKQLSGLYGPIFHFHFLSDDKSFLGHLDDFVSSNITIDIGQVKEIHQEFATDNDAFNQAKL